MTSRLKVFIPDIAFFLNEINDLRELTASWLIFVSGTGGLFSLKGFHMPFSYISNEKCFI